MPVMLTSRETLEQHDAGVHEAHPHHEPDEAEVLQGIFRSANQEYAQSEIDANHHLLVVRLVGRPAPPRGPQEHKRSECKADGTDEHQGDAKERYARWCHCLSLESGL